MSVFKYQVRQEKVKKKGELGSESNDLLILLYKSVIIVIFYDAYTSLQYFAKSGIVCVVPKVKILQK